MQCPKCGVENEEGRDLCGACSWVLSSKYAEPTEDARTSGLAITALVLGILSMCTFMLTALPAIIFGIVALVKIGKSRGELKGNGFAIAGMAVPAIVPILLAIMMPALIKTKHFARRMVCMTNLKGLGTAMMVYANDDRYDRYPTAYKWNDLLVAEADVEPKSFQCESVEEGPSNYAMNKNVASSSSADMVVLFEAGPGWNQVGGKELLNTDNHEGKGCNILFNDGHTEFICTEMLGSLNWGGLGQE